MENERIFKPPKRAHRRNARRFVAAALVLHRDRTHLVATHQATLHFLPNTTCTAQSAPTSKTQQQQNALFQVCEARHGRWQPLELVVVQIQPVCNVSDASTATPKPSVPLQLAHRTQTGRQRAQQVVMKRNHFNVGKQHAQLLGKRVHAVAVQQQPAQRRVNGRKTSCCITHVFTPSRCSCVY